MVKNDQDILYKDNCIKDLERKLREIKLERLKE